MNSEIICFRLKEFQPYTRTLYLLGSTELTPESKQLLLCDPYFDSQTSDAPDFSWVDVNVEGEEVTIAITAIIDTGSTPHDYFIMFVDEDGKEIMTLEIPSELSQIQGGIIGLSQDGDDIRAHCWGSNRDAKIQMGRIPTVPDTQCKIDSSNTHFHSAKSKLPLTRPSIHLMQDGLHSLKFTNFRVFDNPRLPSSIAIEKYRNVHEGKIAWLIGNGPSVKIEDLEKLGNAISFTFNRFYLAHENTSFRGSYHISADKQMIQDFGPEMISTIDAPIFFAEKESPEIDGDFIWLRLLSIYPSLFSFNTSSYITPGGGSMYVALQLAYFMGIRKFYIYGADFTFNFKRNTNSSDVFKKATGDGNHFIENYRSNQPWCPPSYRNITNSLWCAYQLMEAEGGFIKNATHGGKLNFLPREDFETAVKNTAL